MRLTLRTLLAYLDNTLDPQDAQALKVKLTESSFATQLVQRIRESLSNPNLAAPAPDAVGPIEDANAISEYLDSTLSAAQIAEIERACLDSDPHLAEAAACHQILTMVLGKPANVPSELRQRIYQLPDRSIDQIASGANVSSLSVPVEPDLGDPAESHSAVDAVEVDANEQSSWADDIPTADASVMQQSSSVRPVGVGDSGVSDAPTRLRELEEGDHPSATPTIGSADPAIAGARPRSITDSEIYGGSIRPSRITPWLVTLAVAGLLLFALAQIFAPLMSRDRSVADVDSDADQLGQETEVPADQSPPMVDITERDDEPQSVSDANAESLPSPVGEPAPEVEAGPESVATNVETAAENMETPADDTAAAKPIADGGADPSDEASGLIEKTPVPPTVTEPPSGDTRTVMNTEPPPEADVADAKPGTSALSAEDAGESDATRYDSNPPAEPVPLGKMKSSDSLLAVMQGEHWQHVRFGMPIDSGMDTVCAPTFRSEATLQDNLAVTMIGPARLKWDRNQDSEPLLAIEHGKFIFSPKEEPGSIDLLIAGQPRTITFSEVFDSVAIEVSHSRDPGIDPLNPENVKIIRQVIAVRGTIDVSGNGDQTIEERQQWLAIDDEQPVISELDPLPNWVEVPDANDRSLEASARVDLLELLSESDQHLELALREATSFRKSEVAALAAQTLLFLGRGEVYFDAVGILNQSDQRAYWPDHYLALQTVMDQGGQSATDLTASIQRTDSANGDAIVRLLTGYSQQQLVDGGDLELVEMLNSPSMAVRVLATENLRRITDALHYFPAEQENAVRREPHVKKWLARQRRGEIRWPE